MKHDRRLIRIPCLAYLAQDARLLFGVGAVSTESPGPDVPIIHERRAVSDRRHHDHGGYPGFDRRIRGDQRKCRGRLDLLSDVEWKTLLEMPNLLELSVSVPVDLQMHFDDLKRREGK